MRKIKNCSACGQDHEVTTEEIIDHELFLDGDRVTHVGICPNTTKVLFIVEAANDNKGR